MLKKVRFGSVAIGDFFREIGDGTPLLKTDAKHGMYQRWGTRYEPMFRPYELVYVEVNP